MSIYLALGFGSTVVNWFPALGNQSFIQDFFCKGEMLGKPEIILLVHHFYKGYFFRKLWKDQKWVMLPLKKSWWY